MSASALRAARGDLAWRRHIVDLFERRPDPLRATGRFLNNVQTDEPDDYRISAARAGYRVLEPGGPRMVPLWMGNVPHIDPGRLHVQRSHRKRDRITRGRRYRSERSIRRLGCQRQPPDVAEFRKRTQDKFARFRVWTWHVGGGGIVPGGGACAVRLKRFPVRFERLKDERHVHL